MQNHIIDHHPFPAVDTGTIAERVIGLDPEAQPHIRPVLENRRQWHRDIDPATGLFSIGDAVDYQADAGNSRRQGNLIPGLVIIAGLD